MKSKNLNIITEMDLEPEQMTKNEIFEKLLEYEGLMGYDDYIKEIILDVYGIEIK